MLRLILGAGIPADLSRRPAEIRLGQIEVRQRVAHVRVEPGGDHDEVRPKLVQPGKNGGLEGFAELWPAVARPQRRVDDVVVLAALGGRAGAGIERHLMRRAIHHGRIGPEDRLGAVAVVHVEIDDGRALGAVAALGVARGDRRVVEQAEAHRHRGFRMMPGRANRHEGVRGLPGHHLVDRKRRTADRARCRFEAAGRHRGVGIEAHQPVLRHRVANLLDVFLRMTQRDDFQRRARRMLARQRHEALVLEHALDRAQPVRTLRMAERRQMLEAGVMGDEQGQHAAQVLAARLTPAGGVLSSGTKKSDASGSLGSTR